MTTFRTRAIVCAAITATLLTGCGKKDQQAADTTNFSATADTGSLRVSDIQLGKAVGADKRISNAATEFGVRDTIYASVTTNGTGSNAALTARWMYNGTQVVNETSETISPTGAAVTEFHITKPTAWPTGRYTVEVMLNGSSAGRRDFEVK